MAKQGSKMRKTGRALGAALLAMVCLPAAASATVFSFGTINPTDVITSLSFSPSTTKTSFDPGTGVMHVEAYLSQINFSNRPNITGIAPNTVLLTSDIMLDGPSFSVTESSANNPRSMAATFTNGMVDLSIFDTLAFLPLLDTDYSSSLAFTATETGSIAFPLPVTGQLSGDLTILGTSDPDFLSAFAPFGELDANFSGFFSDTFTVGSNLCNIVKASATNYGATQVCSTPAGYALDDFTTNAVITIIPVPEPGTALLLGLGLVGVAALRRK